MPTAIGFDPSTYDSDVLAPYSLGEVYTVPGSGKLYRVFKYVDFATAPHGDGDVMEWASTTTYSVTADRSGGTSLGRMPAGVACRAAVANNHYQFFLVQGLHSTIGDAANGCTAGRKLTTHATTDGDAANVVNAYDISFGDCIDATSSTTCIVHVRLL